MLGQAGTIVVRLIVPLAAFLFVGVPLESYVRGLDGLFTVSGDVLSLITHHMITEAAVCFYCITVLLECIVIVTRPHIRTQTNLPVTPIISIATTMSLILAVSYVSIRRVVEDNESNFDIGTTEVALFLAAVITVSLFIFVHVIDYIFSDAVSVTPHKRTK